MLNWDDILDVATRSKSGKVLIELIKDSKERDNGKTIYTHTLPHVFIMLQEDNDVFEQ